MSEIEYVGSELDLFSAVHNWKSYWSSRIRPFVLGDVLEVGAGIGANTPFLDRNVDRKQWVCLEPDPQLFAQLRRNLQNAPGARSYDFVCGTLQDIEAERRFDTIVYIDVLEHIEKDADELSVASSYLRPGGRIVILSPAHQWLFTPFDAAIGHFRRYNRSMLRAISSPSLCLERLIYLDSVGLLLSLGNSLLLRQSMPTKAQLRVWDGLVIPVSRVLDRCLFNSVGKSIVGVWRLL
jgi:SAM-dependent methyltransferase